MCSAAGELRENRGFLETEPIPRTGAGTRIHARAQD